MRYHLTPVRVANINKSTNKNWRGDVGEGPRGSNGARLTLLRISVFHSATHNQTVPLWCWFPSGWACARPRPLWVSPTTSPVRLGVSPAAAPTPTGAFTEV